MWKWLGAFWRWRHLERPLELKGQSFCLFSRMFFMNWSPVRTVIWNWQFDSMIVWLIKDMFFYSDLLSKNHFEVTKSSNIARNVRQYVCAKRSWKFFTCFSDWVTILGKTNVQKKYVECCWASIFYSIDKIWILRKTYPFGLLLKSIAILEMSEAVYFPDDYSKNRSLWRGAGGGGRQVCRLLSANKVCLYCSKNTRALAFLIFIEMDVVCRRDWTENGALAAKTNSSFKCIEAPRFYVAPQTYVWHLGHIFRGRPFSIFIFVHYIMVA